MRWAAGIRQTIPLRRRVSCMVKSCKVKNSQCFDICKNSPGDHAECDAEAEVERRAGV
jgi:hypothetical protein